LAPVSPVGGVCCLRCAWLTWPSPTVSEARVSRCPCSPVRGLEALSLASLAPPRPPTTDALARANLPSSTTKPINHVNVRQDQQQGHSKVKTEDGYPSRSRQVQNFTVKSVPKSKAKTKELRSKVKTFYCQGEGQRGQDHGDQGQRGQGKDQA